MIEGGSCKLVMVMVTIMDFVACVRLCFLPFSLLSKDHRGHCAQQFYRPSNLPFFLYWYSSIFSRCAESAVFVFHHQFTLCQKLGDSFESVVAVAYCPPYNLILTHMVGCLILTLCWGCISLPEACPRSRGRLANSYKHVIPCNSFIPISGNCI